MSIDFFSTNFRTKTLLVSIIVMFVYWGLIYIPAKVFFKKGLISKKMISYLIGCLWIAIGSCVLTYVLTFLVVPK